VVSDTDSDAKPDKQPPAAASGPSPALPPLPTSEACDASERYRLAGTALCIGMLCLGVVWRFVDLDYPRTFSFDEYHFVSNARNYIAHQLDWNDHPPLGKLVLVPAILLFGDRGLGWRLSSALFGLAIIALAGLSAGKFFRDRRVGLLTAGFVAIDGFFVSYARTALIDNPLTAFIYAALALMLWARSLAWFAGAALCVGLAVSSKWTGVTVLLLAPLLLRRMGKKPWHVLWMFALASLVYLGIETAALAITRQPISLAGMLRSNLDLLQHHAGFTVWDNNASSKWYTWPFLIHPIVMYHETLGPGKIRATSTVGNLLLWFATTASMGLASMALARAAWRWWKKRTPIPAFTRDQGWVLLAMATLMLPFIVTHRQSYIFHYLGAYGLGLGLLAARLAAVEKRWPRLALGFLAGAVALSLFYVPLWTAAPLSSQGYLLRLPFPGWR
jgi:dolichyl-phosphate-mannose--protein O-mannosyl transferase